MIAYNSYAEYSNFWKSVSMPTDSTTSGHVENFCISGIPYAKALVNPSAIISSLSKVNNHKYNGHNSDIGRYTSLDMSSLTMQHTATFLEHIQHNTEALAIELQMHINDIYAVIQKELCRMLRNEKALQLLLFLTIVCCNKSPRMSQ
jgi:hypothetical protein